MILIEGEQGFKVESAASTVIALRMAGFQRSYSANGSEQFTLAGKPKVTISYLNARPMPAYQSEAAGFSTAFECPVLGCEGDHR
jgi:hypothetical protein